MKVVMLRVEEGRPIFLSQGLTRQEQGLAPGQRRTRFRQLTRDLQAIVLRQGRRLGPWMRRVRDWLNRRVSADESMLAALRDTQAIELLHPADLSPESVETQWREYLQARQAVHLRGLALNLLVAPLTLLLALVPGPNFVGYWFVYRAYSHGVILRGARRALGTSIAIEWLPCAGLIAEQPPAQVERLSTAATRHEGRSFETVLSQILGTPPPRVEAGAWGLQAAPPAPTAVSEAPSAPPGLGRRLVASIPNLLTASRLVLAILFPWVDPRLWLPLFLAAAVTEFLDGALSRWLHAITWTGQLLDPIADKLFVLAVLVTLWSAGVLAGWMILLIAARDLLVLIGSLWVLAWGGPGSLRRMPPRWPGKVATAAQFLLLLLTITQKTVNPWALYPTAGLSLFAGLDYLRRFR